MKERTNKLFSLLISAILVAQPLLANGVIAWAETDLSPATTVSTSTETSESETSSTEEGQISGYPQSVCICREPDHILTQYS